MATYVFRKTIPIAYTAGPNPSNGSLASDTTSTIIRQYLDVVVDGSGNFDPTQFSLTYNGQQLDTSTDAPTAKYYYSVVQYPLSGTITGFTLTISANSSYTNAGYSSPTPLVMTIGVNDIFFLNYTHTVTV